MRHTSGPWYTANMTPSMIRGPQTEMIVHCFDGLGSNGTDNANAARIVACVNALDGIAEPAKAIAQWKALAEEAMAARGLLEDSGLHTFGNHHPRDVDEMEDAAHRYVNARAASLAT